MSKELLELETLDRSTAQRDGTLPRLVTLTIVHHPETQRVGERARFPMLEHARARIAVGRAEPMFRAGHDGAAAPLVSPFVSRKPLWIEGLGDGGVRLDATQAGSRIDVDGAQLTGTLDVTPTQLEDGVVVQVGSHVVLLLHREAPLQSDPALLDGRIIGASEAIEGVRAAVQRVGADGASVLVRGATGSGKELVAAAIHHASKRRGGPFVAVNMAAVPPTLAASELFGHVRGAFSGADQAHDGFFVRAHGGTLFLDEVADTPNEVQAALLRVLETGEVLAVGGRAPRKVDVRIVAATDGDLEAAIDDGRFRAPLLYRLAANEIRVPPLRERRSDIGRLVAYFLMKELVDLGRQKLLQPALTDDAPWLSAALVARLARYDWPGNVRQLRSVCHAIALASDAPGGLADAELERLMPRPRARPSGGAGDTPAASPAERRPARPDRARRRASRPKRSRRCCWRSTSASARRPSILAYRGPR
ncbi:MAG: sigma 54-interacting transcriptional regulator [Myxococcota bacterium]